MHICIVAPEQLPVPPLMGGSVEICIHAIARQLAKEHQVTVVGRRHRRLPNRERHGNLTYIRVPAKNYSANVVKELRKGEYDWIQVDNRPRLAARIKTAFPRKRISLFLHSLTFVTPPRLSGGRASALLAKPDLIVVNSSSLYKELAARFPQTQQNMRKVLLGVDIERFRAAVPKETARDVASTAKRDPFTVLFVGRVIPRKGIPVLLRAMRELRKSVPQARVVIAGGGRPAFVAKLKRMALRLNVPATFVGLMSHRNIHRIYRRADVFVCPSQQHEAFGLVNIEAMASGLPVVASHIGGISEAVVHGRNGYLVDQYKDPRGFVSYLAALANQPELRRVLGGHARADAAAKFSWSVTAHKLEQLYKQGDSNLSKRRINVTEELEQLPEQAEITAAEQSESD